MNDYFQENKRSLFILISLLFILAIVLYLLLLHPLLGDLSKKEKDMKQLESEIEILEAKLENVDDESLDVDIDIEQLLLEKKIRKERDLDHYILSLQQLELISKSKILEVQFVYDSSFDVGDGEEDINQQPVSENKTEQVNETETENDNETDDEDQNTSDVPTVDPEILKEKPDYLHVITVSLRAISPSYNDFIELLREIENNERISIVTALEFTQPTEIDEYFSDEPQDSIEFEAELTTFYYAE